MAFLEISGLRKRYGALEVLKGIDLSLDKGGFLVLIGDRTRSCVNAAGGSAGPGGIFTLALSAIDIALWDIKGKALDQPLWKLLGGHRDRVPTYASGALMRGLSLDRGGHGRRPPAEDKGFREMKTQLALPGEPTPAERGRAHAA